MPLFRKKAICPSVNRDGTIELDGACIDDYLEKNSRVVLMFYRSSCGHCQKMEPLYAQLCLEMKASAVFCKVSTPENMDLVRRFSIQGTPTFMVFVKGQSKSSVVGERTKEALKAEIERALASP